MGFFELFLIGIGLSMDAFAVAICKGLGMERINKRDTLLLALFFGGFQALMPLTGYLLGSRFASYIERWDHWIAFVLLAFIGGNKNFQNTKHRLLGYQIAMERHNLPLENDHILFGEFSEFSGYQQGKTILNMLHRPTAAICASDPLAIGCMRALTEGGLRLPDDFAVIGFGNIEASKYVTPSLSTVSQPSQEMGAIAAATLIQMLENPIILSQKVRLKTNLVLRDSSGSPIGSR